MGLARAQVYQTNGLSAMSDQVSGKGGSKPEQEPHLQQQGQMLRAADKGTG